ncbi:DUF3035 domain-containing protein [Albimonas sp. CAU 1670]|uniref:DUF3035 domain-containing protein n=1 Tax=Albimonas sp. CAU 1670 TaxID=3032599 RepID=UPI0023DAAEF2|nr:DUF3035 domain-containing protein [Albimonas sp. CAU 1670]MDF2233704.1 DUF3035 domain-containing protein [Albimonas sp. CAU 1670]
MTLPIAPSAARTTIPGGARRPLAGRLPRAVALLGAAAALAACSGGREAIGDAMGLNYESPNPFNVSPHAPLRLPPSFETLPPPQPGETSPLEPRPSEAAQAALGAGPAAGATAPTPGELALLDAAGAEAADPTIRQRLVDEEPPEKESIYALDSIFGYKINDPLAAETLDARDEAETLRTQGAPAPTPSPARPESPSNEITIPLGG